MRISLGLAVLITFEAACGNPRSGPVPDAAITTPLPDARTADTTTPDSGPLPTTQVSFRGNLSPDTVRTFDSLQPLSTSNLASRFDIVTKAGASTPISVYFVYEGPAPSPGWTDSHCWSYHALVPGPGFPHDSGEEISGGKLCFNGEGHLTRITPSVFSPDDAGTSTGVRFDFGHPTSEGGNGDDGVTGYAWKTIITGISVHPDPGIGFPECPASQGMPRLSPNCIPKPCPSHDIQVYGNLDPTAPLKAFNIDDPIASSNLATEFTVQTSLGDGIPVALHFSRLSSPSDPVVGAATVHSLWRYHLVCDGRYLHGGTVDRRYEVAGGTLSFTQEGRLVSNSQDPVLGFNPWHGMIPQTLRFDFGTALSDGPGPERMSALPGKSEVTRVDIDACLTSAP